MAMRVVNADQMREADRRTIEDIGVPSAVLMENAGRQVVSAMEAAFERLADARVAVLAGRGNNGGDGFVVARVLWQAGVDVQVYVVGSAADIRGDARLNLDILGRLGLDVVEILTSQDWELHGAEVLRRDIVVDALFGTGLKTPLAGLAETIAEDLNASAVPVVAVDLPSGLSADDPAPVGPVVEASLTVTFAAPKLPLMLPPGEDAAGSVVVADIGIPPVVIEELAGPRIEAILAADVRPLVQARARDAHKGHFGHVLVVAGSRGRTGAAHLGAVAALRSGAGLATVATPASCLPIIASMGAEYMTLALDELPDGTVARDAVAAVLAGGQDVIAAGPGLGTAPDQAAFVTALLERASARLVLDADALTVLAGNPSALRGTPDRPVVITPHPGEMARLVGLTVPEVQRNRLGVARDFATAHHVYVILKGYRTLVATPEGVVYINPTGNPGMATGGSGDVLTGMIAGWLAQGLGVTAACLLGVYLHGAAGDRAAADLGEVAMTAGDIVAQLGAATMDLVSPRAGANGEA
jgi:ADP-dependent NAD(P)H-hydrate dehydratase / NAD(P)H-hydrate epimerase